MKQPPAAPTAPPKKSLTPMIAGALIVGAIAIGVVWYVRDSAPADAAAGPATADAQSGAASLIDPPANAKFGPHKQAALPFLQFPAYAPPRAPEVVRAAFTFAAEHPEVLGYVPCFCGCQRMGHRGNDDCFVAARAGNGDVTAWEPHGMECQICIDVAHQSEELLKMGTSVRDIRGKVEQSWSPRFPNHTPTPLVPKDGG
jgi:hypothetical protein